MTTSIATAEIHTLDLAPIAVHRLDMWHPAQAAIAGTSPRYAAPAAAQTLVIPPRTSWWHRLAHVIAVALRRAAVARRVRHAVRALHALDDRTLADMGLVRSEIAFDVRNGHPRWHRPVRQAPSAD